jgi:predicted ATPase/DNA-binding winged helix-turn-helix (wHTH) protein
VHAGWRFRGYTFEPRERRLRAAGADVAVGARALDVLGVLVERAGRLVGKAELLDLAWPGLVVEENNLQVQVSALRRALGPGAIATVPGRGYRFEWPVEPLAGAPPAARSTPPADPAPATGPLPVPLTALVGREQDRTELIAACRGQRLVTVVGPGGIGKTRLALEVARDRGGDADVERIAFCDLTPVAAAPLVAAAVASAACAPAGEGDAVALLAARLGTTATLLVIDNAEHVRGALAELLARVLEAAPRTRALVTSQVPLELPGEWLHRLGPLSLPPPGAAPADAIAAGAVALFVAAARAADRRFALDEANVAAVVETCRRLDGVPLALQLAAARVPQLGAGGLAARLDQRFRLLARSGGTGPTRQQALAAALDWSHGLLDADERAVFRRLGAFAGEFALDDAIAVVADGELDEWRVTDLLGQLVDRSLVVADGGDPPRCRLLETVRLYSLERLVEAGEVTVLVRAIAHHEARGDRQLHASAAGAAAVDYATALELCARLPAGEERDARELGLQLKLGPAVQSASSPGCPRCEAVYGRAVELARRGADRRARFEALWGYWQFLAMAGRDREAAPLTEELGELAAGLGDDGCRLEACHARFSTAQLLGDAAATVAHTTAAIALYDPDRHHALTHRYGGHDPGVCALGQGSVALWLTGECTRALATAPDAECLGQRFGHAYTEAVGHYYAAMTYAACGEVRELARAAAALVAVSERHGMAVLLTEGRLFAARAEFEAGRQQAGRDALARAYEEIVAGGDFAFVPYYATLVADAHLAAGDPDAAADVLDTAERIAADGQGFFLPEVLRLQGEVTAARGDQGRAIARFAAARALAVEQGAKSLLLRAATSEARLRSARGDHDAAVRVLGPVLASWPADDRTRDVARARALAAAAR